MIIATNRSGLCSRLKCILQCAFLDKNFKVFWLPNIEAGCKWKHLFKTNIATNLHESILKHLYKNNTASEHERKRYEKKHKVTFYYGWRFVYKDEIVDFMFHNTPDELKKSYIKTVKLLQPVDCIQSEIDKWKKEFNEHTVSLGIRSWKEVRDQTNERDFHFNEFIDEIDNLVDDKRIRFFVVTDDNDIYKFLGERYGRNRFFTYPRRTVDANCKTIAGMQDALTELYLSGQSNKMILTWHSSFTEMQWWLGGAKAEVKTVSKWRNE